MLKITAYDGKICKLSDEVYEVLVDDHPSSTYKKGALVRLISGINRGGSEVGYHFNKEYSTVCRVLAEKAEFCGIKKSDLKLMGTFPKKYTPDEWVGIIITNGAKELARILTEA
jgi:hypothetical protein